MKKTEEAERREQVRKASALLQDMKKTSEKEEMAYRGITTSRAAGEDVHNHVQKQVYTLYTYIYCESLVHKHACYRIWQT